jgi:hypothetical protein
MVSYFRKYKVIFYYGSIVQSALMSFMRGTCIPLGLLSSATLPRRQKAAEEASIPPLKMIIMNATPRVADFNNTQLFPPSPAAVKVTQKLVARVV